MLNSSVITDYVSSWADLDRYPNATENGEFTCFGEAYRQACRDIYDRITAKVETLPKSRPRKLRLTQRLKRLRAKFIRPSEHCTPEFLTKIELAGTSVSPAWCRECLQASVVNNVCSLCEKDEREKYGDFARYI
jgi:hypothetical protein